MKIKIKKQYNTGMIILLLFAGIFFSGCYNDNEEEIYQYFTANNSGCDTAVVLFSKQMKPFFDNKCNSCHTTNSICNFDTYDQAFSYTKNYGAKLYSTVAEAVHQGVTLSDCEKRTLKKWSENPAP